MSKINFYYFMYFLHYILCIVSALFLPVSLIMVAFNPYLFWLGICALVWFLFNLVFYDIFDYLYKESEK